MRRSSTASSGLTSAERARTILASASTLRVTSRAVTLDVHRHGVLPDGSVLFQAPDGFAHEAAGTRVSATAVDVATVPQADRVRGSVTLAGPVADVDAPLPAGMRMHLTGSDAPGDATLVRLEPACIGLTWHCESGAAGSEERPVDPAAYRAAFPDPLLGYEAAWLPHLQADHDELLVALARYDLGWDDDPEHVRALGIDRFGLVLRVRDAALGTRDLRLAFDRPVTCGCDVRDAFSAMIERALPGAGPIC